MWRGAERQGGQSRLGGCVRREVLKASRTRAPGKCGGAGGRGPGSTIMKRYSSQWTKQLVLTPAFLGVGGGCLMPRCFWELPCYRVKWPVVETDQEAVGMRQAQGSG